MEMRVYLALAILFVSACVATADDAQRWAVWERAFDGPSEGNPYVDVTFSAIFTHAQQSLTVPGFYDGHGTYRLRFMPPAEGIWYDHTRTWVTHASLQTSDMAGGVRFRRKYQKPIVYDECKYEGNVPQGWGNLTPRQMTQRFWLGTLSGCYVGHGETYTDPNDILWWSKGGILHGKSPRRIQWLKDFMAHSPPFHQLQPLGNDHGTYLLAKPAQFYLLYCIDPRPQSVQLAGERPYKVDVVDPWNMAIKPFGTAPAGRFTIRSPKPDLAFRFMPYAVGEKLRPEAPIVASVTYDATQDGNNVHWYFSAPRDASGPTAVTLDRKTNYHVGPLATDLGPLAIGNFNETMRGYGMDRQFRGTIRGLEIYGSRVGGRGALRGNEITDKLKR